MNIARLLPGLVLLLLSSCAHMKEVPPAYQYKGSYINVRSPNSSGWYLVSSSSQGMEFARKGATASESFGAQVLMFQLPETKSTDEFLSLIKHGFELDTDPVRFNVLKSQFRYDETRGYPCVRVTGVVEDKNAVTAERIPGNLLLQLKSLYCRHPVRQDTGFSIIYSYRGPGIYGNLEAEATGFIDGVDVPRPAAK